MPRKSPNKINRARRHPEIEFAIIERLEAFNGSCRLTWLWLGLPFPTRDTLDAFARLEAVGAVTVTKRIASLSPDLENIN